MEDFIEFLKKLFGNKLYINDILKGGEEMRVGKDKSKVNEKATMVEIGKIPDFDIPEMPISSTWHDNGQVPVKVEKDEFISRMRALSEQELEWLMEVIPVDLCMKKIDNELRKAEEYRNAIRDIYKTFE